MDQRAHQPTVKAALANGVENEPAGPVRGDGDSCAAAAEREGVRGARLGARRGAVREL